MVMSWILSVCVYEIVYDVRELIVEKLSSLSDRYGIDVGTTSLESGGMKF